MVSASKQIVINYIYGYEKHLVIFFKFIFREHSEDALRYSSIINEELLKEWDQMWKAYLTKARGSRTGLVD